MNDGVPMILPEMLEITPDQTSNLNNLSSHTHLSRKETMFWDTM